MTTKTSQQIDPFATLREHNYVNLTTFRKSGVPVTTPVWMAMEGNKGYIVTAKNSGKAKRLRNNPAVQIAPSTHMGKALGPAIDAKIRILSQEEAVAAQRALSQKYGWMYQFFRLMWRLRKTETIFLKVTVTT
ncbi:MAG: PPOX class F420-dependent oxidoreductase [Caldilineaceae bacterium]|nr:PPOX class F420-dependent oxidoreductase [Caldilineaceae bacterium]